MSPALLVGVVILLSAIVLTFLPYAGFTCVCLWFYSFSFTRGAWLFLGFFFRPLLVSGAWRLGGFGLRGLQVPAGIVFPFR